MSVRFDVYGVQVELAARADLAPEFGSGLLNWIEEDLSFFRTDRLPGKTELSFVIGRQNEAAGLLPAFRTKMCRAYGWGNVRICDYGGGVVVTSRQDSETRVIELGIAEESSSSLELAYEALYSAFLSALGEALDRRRYHRVHALGLAHGADDPRSVLVLLPTGGGKSAIAALLMDRPEFKIYSDESPLLHDGRIFPFPVRGALRPEVAQALGISNDGRIFRRKLFPEKVLIPFDSNRVAPPARIDWILVGRRAPSKAGSVIRTEPTAKFAAAAALLDSSVIGRGLAQMSEYMVRSDSFRNLPKIAWDRLQESRRILQKAKVAWFDVTDNAHHNAEALLQFLAVKSRVSDKLK